MASSRRSSLAPIVLPGIRDMFPEYISPPRPSFHPSPLPFPHHSFTSPPSFSCDVLRAAPQPPSLVHVSSAQQLPRPESLSPSSEGDFEEQQGGSTGGVGDPDKKHVCGTCGKRFNRPSSLKIHENSHTGALPYTCPHPNCGRAFNVNSNMRRHYRNHFASASNVPPYAPAPLPVSSTPTSPSVTSPADAPSHYSTARTNPWIDPTSPGPTSSSSSTTTSHAHYTASPQPQQQYEPVQSAVYIHPRVLDAKRRGYSESDARSERRR